MAVLALSALAVGGVGSSAAYAAPAEPIEIQLLGINDFHGRLEAAPQHNIAGAAVLAGAVTALRTQNPNTVFVSAGDNVGGSTFTSFVANDEPTIRALTAAGLEVSAVGNHEFDQGYRDLVDRIIPSYGSPNLGLGANVRLKATGGPALPEYAIIERGGVKIGFIGVVTEDTATAVTAEFVQDVAFEDQLATASEVADRIANDVDVTVVLSHDGSPAQDCAAIATEDSSFGNLVRGMNGKADAIISGHTHNAYACNIDGLPVISSGFYGAALSQVKMSVDALTGDVLTSRAAIIPLISDGTPAFSADPAVANLVAEAVAAAEQEGAQPVGKISASVLRGGTPSGSDRGVESALGNLIADIMHAKVPDADIAIVNPGSLRADLLFTGDGTLSYRDVASVQPFGNTLISMTLTGAQMREILEAQWYADGGAPLKRHLAVSEGFSYTYNPDAPGGSRIGTLTLNDTPVTDADTVRIVTNGFLASGGDGFATFTQGAHTIDTGYNDLQVTVEYFAAHAVVDPPALSRAVASVAPEPNPDPGPHPLPDTQPNPLPEPTPAPGEHGHPSDLANTGASRSSVGGMIGGATALVVLGTGLLAFALVSRRRAMLLATISRM